MARAKIKRKDTIIDMTPMVDVAFLLLTFFMLTTKFKTPDPVEIVTPSAISTTVLPETDVALVTISKDGTVYYGLDDQDARLELIKAFDKQYNMGLTDDEMKKYSYESTVGMPLSGMKKFLDLPTTEIAKFKQEGIPIDSADQELGQWLRFTRNVARNPKKLQFVIKADDATKYEVVDNVLQIFKDQNIYKLHLITSLKSIPPGTPAYQTAQGGGGEVDNG